MDEQKTPESVTKTGSFASSSAEVATIAAYRERRDARRERMEGQHRASRPKLVAPPA
jgi:hypothetical protein